MGPLIYAKHLVSGPRLPFTAAYFGAIAMTLYFAVGVSPCFSPQFRTMPWWGWCRLLVSVCTSAAHASRRYSCTSIWRAFGLELDLHDITVRGTCELGATNIPQMPHLRHTPLSSYFQDSYPKMTSVADSFSFRSDTTPSSPSFRRSFNWPL